MMKFFGNLPACTVVKEACAGSHFVARELMAMGHKAKLIDPQFVRPFVKSNKNDFVDAEAICEACRTSDNAFRHTQDRGSATAFNDASHARISGSRSH
jgi:transposase